MRSASEFRNFHVSLGNILEDRYVQAVKAAYSFLRETPREGLRALVGQTLDFIPDFEIADKRSFVESYRKPVQDDILTGYGLFKITEGKVLQMDWTGGHYQLPLGYHFPGLDDVLVQARKLGIVDDTHNNTPGRAVKLLASELVRRVNLQAGMPAPLDIILSDDSRLNRVTCVDTGTVAMGAALKSILYRFREFYENRIPVFIVQEGNYHGTDFLEQHLRGMWNWLFTNVVVEAVQPNDGYALADAFRRYENVGSKKIAAVIMEPVLMNNRAIYLKPEYVSKARELCDGYDAVLVMDEIQTGLWSPAAFMANEHGGVADIIAVGKGLTSGFSPLAYMICKSFLDNQDQYSSISTNGNADMAALAGLIVLQAVRNNAEHIEATGSYYFEELQNLRKRHPGKVSEITGRRHLAGINIAGESLAGKFHKGCLSQGIFVRLQTYKEGASTVITKPAIIADAGDVDFVIGKLDEVLRNL